MNDLDRLELTAECAEVIVHLGHLLGRMRECGMSQATVGPVRNVEVAKMLVQSVKDKLEAGHDCTHG